jgi:hypothetical protein
MEQSPSWAANGLSDSQNNTPHLMQLKLHHHIHNNRHFPYPDPH